MRHLRAIRTDGQRRAGESPNTAARPGGRAMYPQRSCLLPNTAPGRACFALIRASPAELQRDADLCLPPGPVRHAALRSLAWRAGSSGVRPLSALQPWPAAMSRPPSPIPATVIWWSSANAAPLLQEESRWAKRPGLSAQRA